jgi:hypothetical protein
VKRLSDAGWVYGSLVEPAIEKEPDEAPKEIASVLGAAEDIINAVVPTTREEVAREQARAGNPWNRLSSRFRRGPKGGNS